MFARIRIAFALVVAVMGSLVFATPFAGPAEAAGNPDVSLAVSMPAETLHGDTTEVTLTASNPGGPDGFNLSYRVVLPTGVSYVSGGAGTPIEVADKPNPGETTLFFENVSDLLASNEATLTFVVHHAVGSHAVGSSFAITADAHVNIDPRLVPDFDPDTGTVTGDSTGSDTDSASTDIAAFRVVKSEPSPEAELLRGLHHQTTVYTITIENNPNAPTDDFTIEDWIPAGIEFLACGGGDNSTVGDEYTGSGSINTPVPANCVAPTIVETVNTNIPAGLPAGVYTHVIWDSTGALGDVDIPAGGSYAFKYAAAIPMQMNTMTWAAGVPLTTDGSQASNIDNNNGASTQETGSELAFTNRAYATGTYTGDSTVYTHAGETTVTSEDVALQKTVSPDSISPDQTSTWTVSIQTSEYTGSASSIQVVDTIPDGLEPASSTPTWTSATANGDGTWTVVWDLADMGADGTAEITYTTTTLSHYRGTGLPVLAGDSWENHMELTADVDGRGVSDESSAGQTAGVVSIHKDVAVAGGTVTSCGEGTGLTWNPDQAGLYGPGDRVCWRLTVNGNDLFGGEPEVKDFLPNGFEYESWDFGTGNTADEGNILFDGSGAASGYLRWYLKPDADLNPNRVFEVVVSSIVSDPGANDAGDIAGNLMKFTGKNTSGDPYQFRDDAEAVWGEPAMGIAKSATHTTVQGGDSVAFTIAVPNTGNVDALDVEVWDLLPAGLDCGTVAGPSISHGGTCNSGTDPNRIEWTIPTIAAGGSVDLTYTVTIPAGVGAGETFTNQTGVRQYETAVNTGAGARFVYIPSDNIDPDQEASANTDPLRAEWTLDTAALGITKTRTTEIREAGNTQIGQATIGERVDYTVTVTIPEGTSVYDGRLVDNYTETTLGYVPGSATATLNGGSLPAGWTLDDTGGRIRVFYPSTYTNAANSGDDVLVLTFPARILDHQDNRRGVRRYNGAVQRWNDSAGLQHSERHSVRTRIVEPNLTIAKTDDDNDGIVVSGQTVRYTIEVTNDNSIQFVSMAHDLVVTDTLPAELDCGDVTNISNGGTCTDSNPDVITWTATRLRPGRSLTRTYDATFPNPIVTDDPFTNTATVVGSSMAGAATGERDAGSPNGGPGSGYQATDQDTLYAPRTGTTKSVTPDEQTVGEPVRYTVTVHVPKNTIVYDATIIDNLPDGIGVTSPYTASSTCEEGSAGSGTPCSPAVTISELTSNANNDVGWFLGDLAASNAERFVTIAYDAVVEDVGAAVDGAVLTNTVTAYGNRTNEIDSIPLEVPLNPSYDVHGVPATANVTVREPHLVLTKHVLDGTTPVDARRALPNDDLTYEVTLTNDGHWPAYDATVTDAIAIPSGHHVTAVSITGGTSNGIAYMVTDGDPTDGTLAWTIDGPIPAGQALTISYTVKVWNATEADENLAGPEITNTANNPSYWAVATHTSGDGHREYAGNSDNAEIELDLASIGDYVWFDADGDGVQDASEQPIPNATVTVTYLGPDGVLGGGDDEVHSTVTDASGAYLVEDLPGGNYTVAVSNVPAGMAPSYDLDDGTATPDGTWSGALAGNAAKRDVDFGYNGTGSIGDLVWLDRDGDGTQGTDEPGIGSTDVTVTFFGFDGIAGNADDVVYVVPTAADGSYLVDHLPAGDYDITVTNMPLPNVTPTFDRDPTADGTTDLTLGAGQDITDADFGYNGDGLIGDTVWFDRDRDGVQDPGEPGIAGVDVWLTWPGPDGVLGTPDDVVFTETTDVNGEYLFDGLNSGPYRVVVDVSTLPAGMDNTFDEDGNLNDATEVALAAGESHLTADFGYGGSGSIGDFVWWDLDGDGVQDPGEPGIPGVDVEVVWAGPDGVMGTADDVTYVTTTDADGLYLVEDLPDGVFMVSVLGSLPTSATNTFDFDGGGDSTADVTLAGGIANLGLDFGYVGDNSIGDTVWFDENGNGVQDLGEPPLSGVELTLTWAGVDGVFGTADDVSLPPVSTDSAGFYTFPVLPDGNYRVDVTGGVPVGMAPTYDEDSGTTSPDQTTTVTGLSGGTDHDTADFGYNGTGTIGDTIFWDLDGDGTQGPGEPGFPNVHVDVTWAGVDGVLGTADDVVFTETTDADGVYVVDHLPGGLFRVDVDTTGLPPDAIQTADPDGTNDDSSRVILAAGQVDLDQDFGYRGASSIGDTVWFDVTRDGIQDPGEPGIGAVGVSVTWLGPDGVAGGGDDVVIETITDADGHYAVPGLVGGEYVVDMDVATLPGGVIPHSDLDGGDAATTAVALGVAEDRTDVDFGVVGSAALSGVVWHDHNGDGVVDPGEAGVPNVTVHVTWAGPNGPVTIDVVTDAAGNWALENLPAGEYTAVIDMATVPPDYVATTAETVDVTLPPFGHETVDHGVVGSAVLGSTVWVDKNGNGVLDPGEAGIDGVLVELVDSSGNVVATTATTNGGEYLFTDLVPGTYTVRLVAGTIPSNLEQTYSKIGPLNLETTQSIGEGQTIMDVNFGFQERSLPVTGADLGRFFLLGLLLVAAGAMLRWTARERRESER